MNFIFIEGLRLDVSVGIYSRERVAAQSVEFDLSFGLPEKAVQSDDIANTIDYAKVVECLRAEIGERHFNLLETLGEFVADLICNKFAAPWVRIRIAKPGALRGVRKVGICVQRGKPEDGE
ncbi:MAG: dihydroneopterin aldolase [Azoarcus sp.]|jgi:dihydroneopterin aldolase|nr:dihydroneopterin aldolase [Azoarcus sp.]